ncbi:MAG: aspartate carbamoyltransferase [Chloroflexi bacterium]|nr:aspartate carbamoyltransferase [Chloroflexota bacterium]|tara:strand:+ start:8923 stop:9855 length:933 start_codon:yes stop_codon:yes gene_type:complete
MNNLKKHILDIDHLDRDFIYKILEKTKSLKQNQTNKINLSNKHVCALFYEDSTRTKLSFEKASNNLNVKFHDLEVSKSSVNKGESFYNTLKTIDSIGMDLIIIRHPSSGAAIFAAKHTSSSILNAGDGSHAHPTQTLTDLFTIYEKNIDFTNLEISIVGDFIFSRVARSTIIGFAIMGSKVNIIGPSELVSNDIIEAYINLPNISKDQISISEDIENSLSNSDIVMPLRIQKERFTSNFNLNFETYKKLWKIDEKIIKNIDKKIFIMHPGPVNEETEISHNIAHSDNSLINQQVQNGVFLRQTIISELLS